MIQRILICLVLIISPTLLKADEARALYLNKNYNEAKNIYVSKVESQEYDFAINYNLASTYFRLRDFANAKLYYLKALKIRPNNQDVMHNLSIINKQFIDKQFNFNRYGAHFLGFNMEFVLNIVLFISAGILYLIYLRLSKKLSNEWDRIGLVGIIIWLVIASTTIVINVKQPEFGLVKAEKTQIYSGPSQTQKGLFFAHQGAEFKVLKTANYWYEIQFANGLKGWIKSNKIELI